MRLIHRTLIAATTLTIATSLKSQTPAPPSAAPRPPAIPRAAASTRATVEVAINMRTIGGQWQATSALSGPARIAIEYGQPHARGRTVVGELVPLDSAWRAGANVATHLTTEVDLTIGNLFVPRGLYTLFAVPGRTGWKLIVSKQVFGWGTEYNPANDLGRVDMRVRTLRDPLESLTYWLIPTPEAAPSTVLPHGVLKMAWGTVEASVDWRVGR
ncbi:MAG TPA: DUF2911 domain-containing protein [Gemmatimonadaceae bacterium]|nr:DUF2911 domain-containing protein [Gemmatimonadaceae bacterium]